MMVLLDLMNGPVLDFRPYNGDRFVYALASIPRSGSTLISRALWATGRAGAPSDYFTREAQRDFEQRGFALTPETYRDLLLKYRTSPNGVFGFKVHWDQLVGYFRRGDDIGFHNLITPHRVIYTYRRDRIRQAVSWVIATQTKRFTSENTSIKTPVYNRESIETALQFIEEHEACWTNLFNRHRVNYLSVEYENLSAHYEETLMMIAKFLEIDIPYRFENQPISRLSTPQTDAWIERFVTDCRASSA